MRAPVDLWAIGPVRRDEVADGVRYVAPVHGADVRITLPAGVAGPRPTTLQGRAIDGALEGATDGGRWRAVRASR